MRTLLNAAAGTAAALAFSAFAASAATVTSGPGVGFGASPPPVSFDAGDDVAITDFFEVGETTVSFTFTANDDVNVSGFAVTGVGLIADLSIIEYTLDNGVATDTTFTITPFGTSGFGGGFGDNFSMASGETVSLVFALAAPATTTASTSTIGLFFETAAIPLPAGVLLLGTALGGLAVARTRKTA